MENIRSRDVCTAGSGPVHLNLPFREPLLGEVDELPAPLAELSTEEERPALVALPESVQVERGIIVAGGASGVDAHTISRIAEALSWPILADPLSGVRSDVRSVANFDVLLRHEGFASGHVPQAVLRFGRPPASKVLSMWVKSSGAPVIQVGGPGVIDPDHNVVVHCSADDVDAAIAQGFSGATGSRWAESWRTSWLDVDAIAEQTLSELLLAPELSEPTVARVVADAAPSNARVVVSSSMPVRDLEWFGGRRAAAHSNRGANGIDGVMSTSLGLALTGVPVIAVIGDLAFVHDSNALWGIGAHDVDLRIIVIDNDGAESFLFFLKPQSCQVQSLNACLGPRMAQISARLPPPTVLKRCRFKIVTNSSKNSLCQAHVWFEFPAIVAEMLRCMSSSLMKFAKRLVEAIVARG